MKAIMEACNAPVKDLQTVKIHCRHIRRGQVTKCCYCDYTPKKQEPMHVDD